jgi:hypothetical protein
MRRCCVIGTRSIRLTVLGAAFFLELCLFCVPAYATVAISNVGNLSLGTWSGGGDVTNNDDICIYNSAEGQYRITGTGSSSAGSGFYIATAGGSHSVAYTVGFKDSSGTSGSYTTLTHNSSAGDFSGADQVSSDCSSGASLNANVKVTVLSADLASAAAGSYQGTLTLVVSPSS